MARLTLKTGAECGRVIELNAGIYHIGRSEDNEIHLPDPSVSSHHCEITVSDIGISIHDLQSTNGTFINGERVSKGMLQNGDALRLGDLALQIELPDVNIAIPHSEPVDEGAVAFLPDGSPACFNHHEVPALFHCTACENWWCGDCVRHLKRLSGDFLHFCPQCSVAVVPAAVITTSGKRSLFRRVTQRITQKLRGHSK